MGIQTEIDRIITAVGAAYDAVEAKGGTIPQSETIDGLAAAVSSIKAAPTGPYMEAEYVEDSDGSEQTHKIRTAKLYNHTRISAYEFYGQDKLRGLDLSDPSNNITVVEQQAFVSAGLYNLILPNTITTLQNACFAQASVATFTVPPLVTELPTSAFSGIGPYPRTDTGDDIPINIVLPVGLTKLGQACFFGSSIADITLPDTLTEIGEQAFYYCGALESIELPPALATIGEDAFSNSALAAVTIPASVTSLGMSAFAYCYNMGSIDIQAQVTVIPEGFAQDCPLSSIILPDTVQEIGAGAFMCGENPQVTELTIPASVTSIGEMAFGQNVPTLLTLTVLPTTPPTLGKSAFNIGANTVIKVPAASVDAYKAADGWSAWADKITAI